MNAPGNLGSCHLVPGPARMGVSGIIVRIVVACAAIAAVWALSDVVLVLFLAVLLACVLRGSAEYLAARTGVRDGVALAAIMLVATLSAAGIGWWMVPKLAREGYELVERLSQEWQHLRPQLGPLMASGNGKGPLPALGIVQGKLAVPIEVAFGSSLGVVTGCVVVVVTAIYLAASPELYVGGVLHLVPFPMRPRTREVLARTGQVLRLWVLGQLVDMLAVGVLAGVGLWVLGVPVPFALGVLSALLTFIPYVGAVLAAVQMLYVEDVLHDDTVGAGNVTGQRRRHGET